MQCRGDTSLAQDGSDILLNEVRLPFFDHQNSALAGAKPNQLAINDWIGYVHHIQRNLRSAIHVSNTKPLEHPHLRVVAAALHDDADVVSTFGKKFVETTLFNETDCCRPTVRHLFLLMRKDCRRQRNAAGVAHRIFHRLTQREAGPLIGRCYEVAVDVTGANPQLQHHRGVARLR